MLLLILFCFVSYRHCHLSEKLWMDFIERNTNEKKDKHFNIPESAFFVVVYLNIFVSVISLMEIWDLWRRKQNILFVWKCQKCFFFSFSLFVFHVQPHFQYIFTVIYLLVLLNINILCVFSITIKHIYFQMILFFIKAKMDFGLVSLFLSVHNSQLHALTLCPKCW